MIKKKNKKNQKLLIVIFFFSHELDQAGCYLRQSEGEWRLLPPNQRWLWALDRPFLSGCCHWEPNGSALPAHLPIRTSLLSRLSSSLLPEKARGSHILLLCKRPSSAAFCFLKIKSPYSVWGVWGVVGAGGS